MHFTGSGPPQASYETDQKTCEFEVIIAVFLKIRVFLGMTLCGRVYGPVIKKDLNPKQDKN
jgi:hypothetical protein